VTGRWGVLAEHGAAVPRLQTLWRCAVWSVVQVLYVDGGLVHCLHPTTFEQTAIPEVGHALMLLMVAAA
jgi:hypothetical protein